MKAGVVRILEKYPIVYNILLMIRQRNDRTFVRRVKGLKDDPNLVELIQNNMQSEDASIVCHVEIGGKTEGFFALVRWTLDALYFCDCFSFKPYIRFSSDVLYYDESMSCDNPFEYYFLQPVYPTSEVLKTAKTLVKYETRNRLKAELLNGGISYQVTKEYIEQMAGIMKMYLRFNEETGKQIEQQLCMRAVSQSVLGVHIRGTDYKSNYKNHPQYIPPAVYYEYIDAAMKKYPFEKIYVATDDQEILDEFLKRYGSENVLYAKDVVRGTGTRGIHTTEDMTREHHKYLLGLEVLCDMCALASCGGLISSMSQVSLMSRIYKKSKDEEFLYDQVIDKGVNAKGKMFK